MTVVALESSMGLSDEAQRHVARRSESEDGKEDEEAAEAEPSKITMCRRTLREKNYLPPG